MHSTTSPRSYLLEVTGSIVAGQLQAAWTYSANVHRRETITALADQFLAALRAIISQARKLAAGRLTSAEAALVEDDTRNMLAVDRPVLDRYPLAPAQEDILRIVLHEPLAGVYILQEWFDLEGALDVAAFQRSWQVVLNRHTSLRTAFHWRDHAEPLQVVEAQVALPWAQIDQRECAPVEYRAWLDGWLQQDHARGFTLEHAPLMRLTLIQHADDQYTIVWSCHHLLLDGWSFSILLQEVFRCYAAFHSNREPALPPPSPYYNYIAWLQQQDLCMAETFWRELFAGFQTHGHSLCETVGTSTSAGLGNKALHSRSRPQARSRHWHASTGCR